MPRRLAPLLLVFFGLGACVEAIPPPEVVITIKPTSRLIRRHDGARVHLETSDPLSLEVFDISSWHHVCDAPCNTSIAVGETYRVVRDGRAVTEEFALDALPGAQITIAVGHVQEVAPTQSSPWLTHLF
ncbi:MAG: hypothetical protein ABJE95_11035 [Byssovorax sp.]